MAPTTQGEASQMGILNRANGGNGSISLICVCVCVCARAGGGAGYGKDFKVKQKLLCCNILNLGISFPFSGSSVPPLTKKSKI